jgi:hypothetical protein
VAENLFTFIISSIAASWGKVDITLYTPESAMLDILFKPRLEVLKLSKGRWIAALSCRPSSNQTSATDFPPPMENNGTMDDWFQQAGKVQLIQYYYVFALMIELIESK